MPVAFIADELKKLWDLKQVGALTEDEFAQQKARLLGKQPTAEANPEQPAAEAKPEQPAAEAKPEEPKLKPDGASVYELDSQELAVDVPEPVSPPEPMSSPTPSPKVESRLLVKCPECGAPTFDLAHHRHLPLIIPDRSYRLPAVDSELIVTEDKEDFGKTVADVNGAPQPSPTSIPVPEQKVAPPEKVKKAKVGGGWLILKIGFWIVAFLCVLYIIVAIVSNKPTPANPETKPAIPPSSSTSPSSPTSSVENLSVNRLLPKQLDKHKGALKTLTEPKQRGDMDAFKRILVV